MSAYFHETGYALILTKKSLSTFWAIFSKTQWATLTRVIPNQPHPLFTLSRVVTLTRRATTAPRRWAAPASTTASTPTTATSCCRPPSRKARGSTRAMISTGAGQK
jgi:hypothetical protein